MIKGIGIDIIEIDRIRSAVETYGEKFLARVFTAREISYCWRSKAYRIPELAVRFAAKEAYSKALGTGITGFGRRNSGVSWQDIEIVNNVQGKPLISFKGMLADKAQVSLSHSRDYAVATVYVEE
ncbi:MAG: holo-ACP synthase [Candidatus Margulisiibacteriota bacterium]